MVVVAVGYNFPVILLDNTTWMYLVGLYILVASVAPVWVLLQPRDYLSSYLLYGMIALALVGIVGAGIAGQATNLDIPAFTEDFEAQRGDSLVAASGFLFPALFITIACGAISGFHSLVASGTTSKQLDREGEAQPIAYGGMLLECLVAVDLAVRRCLRVRRIHGRHLCLAHPGLCPGPLEHAGLHPGS